MKSSVLLAVLSVCCFAFEAFSKEPAKSFQFHGSGVSEKQLDPTTGDSGLAKVIKNVRFPNYKSKTFGEAVESYRYFSKREWKETRSSNGKIYVDFTGWLKKTIFDASTVSARGVSIKFLVKPDGDYGVVMVSKLELRTDGNIYSDPLPDIQSILKKLYGNVEIKF